MKNIFIKLSLVLFVLFSANEVYGRTQVVLEHIFDGYYYPFNFPLYQYQDDEKCFYPAISVADNNRISFITYNENYTIKDNYNVTFSIPSNYQPQAVGFSTSLKLADGTPFFIVTFVSQTIPQGSSNHCIAKMYDAKNGNYIADVGASSLGITPFTSIYLINGKPTILIMTTEYDNTTFKTSYKTYVYSLGAIESALIDIYEGENYQSPRPIMIYDMSGRIISQPVPGTPFIEVKSDGSSNVMMTK